MDLRPDLEKDIKVEISTMSRRRRRGVRARIELESRSTWVPESLIRTLTPEDLTINKGRRPLGGEEEDPDVPSEASRLRRPSGTPAGTMTR